MAKRSSRPRGKGFRGATAPEAGPDALAVEESAHAPARRADVREEARSVVIAEEVDDDKTPPHGYRRTFGSSPSLEVHSEEELPSEPLPRFDELTPSEPLPRQIRLARPLPAYDHRNAPTIVLPRRAPSRLPALFAQLAPQQLYVVVAALIVTACATAFIIGAAVTSLFSSTPAPAEQTVRSVIAPSAVAAPSSKTVDEPVTLTDLPVVED